MEVFFYIYLFGLACQDAKSMYINKWWILLSIPFLFVFPIHIYSSLLSIGYGIIGYFFYKKMHWLGSADVYFFFYFGILMGYERFSVAICIGSVLGLGFALLFKKKQIPYLTFLTIGILISYACGYSIWYHCLQIVYP